MVKPEALQEKACSLVSFLHDLVKSKYKTYSNYNGSRVDLVEFADIDELAGKYLNVSHAFDQDGGVGGDGGGGDGRPLVLSIRKPPLDPPPEIPDYLASLLEYEKRGTNITLRLKIRPHDPKTNPLASPVFYHNPLSDMLLHGLSNFMHDSWYNWKNDNEKAYLIYEKLYRFRNQLETASNEELVLALGLLQHGSKHEIKRHVLTLRCEIDLNAKRGELSVVLRDAEERHRLEIDFIDPEIRPDELNPDLQDALDELALDFADRRKVMAVLRVLSNLMNVPSELESEDLRPPKRPNRDGFTWSYAPAIVLRARRSRAHLQLLENARNRCNENDRPFQTQAMDYFLAEGATGESGDDELSQQPAEPATEPPYFPLPTNKEQLTILEKVEKQPVVVVKGPPGTGKSHTIANLISHTLATGGRVLVTAEKGAALKVVRDKLPRSMRTLCITALGSSKKDREALERSLKALINVQETWDPTVRAEEIERLREERARLRRRLAELENDLLIAREAEVKEHRLAGGYGGKAAAIVRQVNERQSEFNWFEDVLVDQPPFPLSAEELGFLTEYVAALSPEERRTLDLVVPKALPEIEHAQHFFDDLTPPLSQGGRTLPRRPKHRSREDLEQAVRVVEQYRDLLRRAVSLVEPGFVSRHVRDALHKSHEKMWEEHARKLRKLANSLTELRDRLAGMEVDFKIDPVQLKSDVEKRTAFLKSGKSHSIFFRRARELRETDYLLDKVRVNQQPPETLKTLGAVYRAIELHEIETAIDKQLPGAGDPIPDRSLATAERLDRVKAFFEFRQALAEVLDRAAWLGEEAPEDLTRPDGVARLLEVIEENLRDVQREEVERQRADLLTELGKLVHTGRAHPCVEKLSKAVQSRDPDLWQEGYDECLIVCDLQRRHARFAEIVRKLEPAAPRAAAAIFNAPGRTGWEARLRNLEHAWYWACARGWVQKYVGDNRVMELQKERNRIYKKHLEVTEELAGLMAHQALFARFDHKTKQALKAWAKAMGRIGKGTGKHAEKHRHAARKYLQTIRDRLPAWVMPLDRLWDTLALDSDPFDLVIVDEASQAAIDSLLLLGFSQRIVVVGDDKQNSPQMIGVEEQSVERLIRQHLGSFHLADEFRPDSSLYDLSYLVSGDNITLVEHYRCVPDIIRFNNREFYDGALIPLRQAPPNVLEPTRLVYLRNGVSEGKNQSIYNHIEAEKIVDQLAELVNDPAYSKKTFGIVVLQGTAQVRLIEQLLTKRLDAGEIEDRRIRVGTSSDFQGDERDVIFLSMVVDNRQRIRALTGINDERRYNVAVSRARDQLWLFTSRDPSRLHEDDLRYRLVRHIQDPTHAEERAVEAEYNTLVGALRSSLQQDPPDPYDSWFEVKVAVQLLKRGYKVLPQFPAGSYRIDLVVEGLRNRLAVECDGDYWHGPDRYRQDMERQFQLERAGWTFVRILESEFYHAPERSIDRIVEACRQMGIEPVRAGRGQALPFNAGSTSRRAE